MSRSWVSRERSQTSRRRRRQPGRTRHEGERSADERGIVTLDWVILVSLVLLIAAVSTVTVSRALGESLGRDDGPEPSVRLHEADIEATDIETAAHKALLASQQTGAPSYDDTYFEGLCEQELVARFPSVIAAAEWTAPVKQPDGSDDPDVRAHCKLTTAS